MVLEVQSLDIVSVNFWSILISLINLLIIFLIIKKFLFAPIKKVFAVRKAEVDKVYDDANLAKDEAEAQKSLYEEKMAGAKDEASQILSNARERADRMSDEIIADANVKAEARYKKAEEEIAQEKKKAMSELKDDISTISLDIAEKIVEREINENDHEKLINEFIEEVGESND
ncbi:MAG: F0F1 ATP synthase subunit B [Clostridia bacterium]|nr:F0F1 ATP synthase subunit B [Clostridia bacterium]